MWQFWTTFNRFLNHFLEWIISEKHIMLYTRHRQIIITSQWKILAKCHSLWVGSLGKFWCMIGKWKCCNQQHFLMQASREKGTAAPMTLYFIHFCSNDPSSLFIDIWFSMADIWKYNRTGKEYEFYIPHLLLLILFHNMCF